MRIFFPYHRNILLTILLLFTFWGQQELAAQSKHELSVAGFGGLSTLKNPLLSNKMGGGFSAGYSYRFNEKWALCSGIEFAFYGAAYNATTLNESYPVASPIDNPQPGFDNAFTFHADYTGYEEKLSALYLQIPVMAQYAYPLGKNFLYGAAGIKIGIPLTATYKAGAQSLSTWGHSNYTGQDYTNEYGFGSSGNPSHNGNMETGPSAALAIEAGMKWILNEKFSLYSGFYFDYGLNNVNKMEDGTHSTIYNYPADYTYNSAVTGKMNLLAAGIKIKIAMGL